jgi:hypothetical protein
MYVPSGDLSKRALNECNMARGKKIMANTDEAQDVVDGKLPPSPLKNIGRGIDLVKMSEEDIISLIYEAINRRLLRWGGCA